MKSKFKLVLSMGVLTGGLFLLSGCGACKSGDDSSDEATDVAVTDTTTTEQVSGEEAVAEIKSAILAPLAGKIVNAAGETVDVAEVAKAPHVLFYYSAHWCPPCRKFTPMLVDFYNNNGGGEKFEIIFVSSDRSEKDMYHYMEETNMPWKAISYDSIDASGIKEFGDQYIPSLTMFDTEGNVVSRTNYDGGVEPSKVLEELKGLL